MKNTVAILLLVLVGGLNAFVPGDEVKSLPGYEGTLPTRQFSGFVEVGKSSGDSRFYHYWFVESANDPTTDPVVLWLNGGPGCSSLAGYLYEQGPLHFDSSYENETIPKLVTNPYAWNRIANMLFLETPIGVGFSYSINEDDYSTNDEKTAKENFMFLQNWFAAYPEYKDHDFYITGESYAGIYVPTLVAEIMKGNDNGESSINLKGFMVGNGCIGNEVGACSYHGLKITIDFLFGHGLYSEALHEKLVVACPDAKNISAECKELVAQMIKESGKLNVYDIYAPCILNNLESRIQPMWRVRSPLTDVFEEVGLVECIDGGAAAKYLDLPEVQEAIHMSAAHVEKWHVCSSKVHYNETVTSLLPIYPTLIAKYRTVIYNGDVDGCVPYIGNEEWTSSLGLAVDQPWRPWMVDEQVAGYVTSYQSNGFQFVTIKGAGHMVPQFKPKQAFAMFERYLNQEPM